jgi:carbonic anhydrase
MQDAWARGQDVTLHGWVYGVHDGLLQDLHIRVSVAQALEPIYHEAVAGISARAMSRA